MDSRIKEIFDELYSPLCNYANAIVRDKNQAEDLVQTVFIQLWENGKLLNLERPQPYLLKAVKYKCLDYLRGRDRQAEVLMSELPEVEVASAESITEEDIQPLLAFFASKLPPKVREVFLLSRTEGMTYREIALECEVSVKTVENQMGFALKKLRVLLKEHGFLLLSILALH